MALQQKSPIGVAIVVVHATIRMAGTLIALIQFVILILVLQRM